MLTRALRSTGADLPFGTPEAAHPGVALKSWFWRFVDGEGAVVLLAATQITEPTGSSWLSVVLAARHADGSRSVVEGVLDDVRGPAPGSSTRGAAGGACASGRARRPRRSTCLFPSPGGAAPPCSPTSTRTASWRSRCGAPGASSGTSAWAGLERGGHELERATG